MREYTGEEVSKLLYVFIGFFMIVISWLENFTNLNEKTGKRICIAASLFLAVISSIRWETGTDWNSYLFYFNTKSNLIQRTGADDFEIGYRILNAAVHLSGGSFTVLLTVLALIVFFAQTKAILYFAESFKERGIYRRCCPNTFLMCMWFIHLGNVFTTRSVVAYVILLYALKYACLKDIKLFLLFVMLAVSIHQTCIFYLAVYPLFNLECKIIKKAYIFFPLAGVFFAVESKNILSAVCFVLPESFSYRIRLYMDTMVQETGMTGIANFILLYIIFLILKNWYFRDNQTYEKFFNLYCIGFIPYLIGITVSGWFIRAAIPYMMPAVLLLPACLRISKKRGSKMMVFMLFAVYLILRFRSNIYQYYDLYMPFKTIITA